MVEGNFGGELAHQGGEQRHGGIVPHGHHHLVEQYDHRLLFREAADAVLRGLLQGDEGADGHLLLLPDRNIRDSATTITIQKTSQPCYPAPFLRKALLIRELEGAG